MFHGIRGRGHPADLKANSNKHLAQPRGEKYELNKVHTVEVLKFLKMLRHQLCALHGLFQPAEAVAVLPSLGSLCLPSMDTDPPLLSFPVGFSPGTTGRLRFQLLSKVVALVSCWLFQWHVHMPTAILSWFAYGWNKWECHKHSCEPWAVGGGCLSSSPASS